MLFSRFLQVRPGEPKTMVFKTPLSIAAASIEPESSATFEKTTLNIDIVQNNMHGFQVLVPFTVCTFRLGQVCGYQVREGKTDPLWIDRNSALRCTGWRRAKTNIQSFRFSVSINQLHRRLLMLTASVLSHLLDVLTLKVYYRFTRR